MEEHIVTNFRQWNQDGHRPFYFSTLSEFCAKHYHARQKISGEIPCLWPNVESSWPDLWPLDREAETALFDAEFFTSLRPGARDQKSMHMAWDWLLDAMDHNQNGIGGDLADDEKKELKQSARLLAKRIAHDAAIRIASAVPSPRDSAFPIVLFNRLSWKRCQTVRARTGLYGHGAMKIPGLRENNFRLIDDSCREIPFRLVKHLQGAADSIEIEFTAEVPAFGMACYYLETGTPQTFPIPFEFTDPREEEKLDPYGYAKPFCIKNKYWQLEIDRVTGEVSIAGADGEKYIDRACIVGLEENRGDYICKMALTGRRFPAVIRSIESTFITPVSAEFEICGSVYGLDFTQTIRLFAESPQLVITNKIHWQPGNFVRLELAFPLPPGQTADIHYGVPFGMVHYPETIYKNGLDFNTVVTPERGNDPDDQIRHIRLASPFVAVNGVTIASDHRMWEFDPQEIRNCMVRGTGWCSGAIELLADGTKKPIQRPPAGEYSCTYVLTRGEDPKSGWESTAPLYAVGVGRSFTGASNLHLPDLPDTSNTTVIGANVKPSEDGTGIAVRLFETEGKSAVIALPGEGWVETDMLENNPIPLTKELRFKPFEVKTIRKVYPWVV